MITGTIAFDSFWSSSWAAPLRGACQWLQRKPGPVVPATPDALAPSWLRPLCVQRVIGKGIAARLKWMREHPDQGTFLYPEDSIPLWTDLAWMPYERAALRSWSEEWLLMHFLMEVERLLRIVQVPPSLLGEDIWTHAALGTCQHLAQVYHEFRRRFVREALLDYIYWEPSPERAAAPREEAESVPTD